MKTIVLHLHLIFLVISLFSQAITYPFENFRPTERLIQFFLGFVGLLALSFVGLFLNDGDYGDISILNFLTLEVNPTNLAIYLFTSIIISVVSNFSFQYIHKEIGFHKFFLNLTLFWIGLFTFLFGKDFILLFAGWEFIGISSIFLISFYHYRKSPVFNSLYVVSFYKFADIILISALLFLKHQEVLKLHDDYYPYIYTMILIAGLVKSASFPFTSWLPRAMEGPTPSSAVYYVGLSINTGILLIIKFLPGILEYELSSNLLVIAGVLTLLYSSIQSRVQSDIKSALAYSASIQLGIILIELYLGHTTFALIHLLFTTFLKTYQFLRTPSLLHIYHSMEGEHGKTFSKTGAHFEFLLPKALRKFFYYSAVNHFYLDAIFNIFRFTFKRVGAWAKLITYPLSQSRKIIDYKSFLWWPYYILFALLVSTDVFTIDNRYFQVVPVVILLISLAMLFEHNASSFIALFSIYKILESFVIHGFHTHEPYKWLAIIVVGAFIFSIIKLERNNFISRGVRGFYAPLTILFMLYFTNFPFFLQSFVNEHIIEAFIEQDKLINLIIYCLANTLLNLGLYNFIFNQVYISEALDG